jgi:hypothetical protein
MMKSVISIVVFVLSISLARTADFTESDYAALNDYCEFGARLPDGDVELRVWYDCMETRQLHSEAEAKARADQEFAKRSFNYLEAPFNKTRFSEQAMRCEEWMIKQPRDRADPLRSLRHSWNVCMRGVGIFKKP